MDVDLPRKGVYSGKNYLNRRINTIRDGLNTPTQTLQWRCVEFRIESKRLSYGRFAISPFRKGQANTVGIAMRRTLLSEMEGSSITSARIEGVKHEYHAIVGMQESVHDILINSKEIVPRSESRESQRAYISIAGPGEVTAGDIIVPPCVEIVDTTQPIATSKTAIQFDIELGIGRDRGYCADDSEKHKNEGFFSVDATFAPIRNVNYSVHSFGSEKDTKEILSLEIWTDGSLTPGEALHEASQKLIDSSIPLPHSGEEEERSCGTGDKIDSNIAPQPLRSVSIPIDIEEIAVDVAFEHIFIDQLELPARAYNCLKEVNVHTIADLLDYGEDDLVRIKNFGRKSVEQVLESLKKRFAIHSRRGGLFPD